MRKQTKNVRTLREMTLADAFRRFHSRFSCSCSSEYSELENLLFALSLQQEFGIVLVTKIIVSAEECGHVYGRVSLGARLYNYKHRKHSPSFGLPF